MEITNKVQGKNYVTPVKLEVDKPVKKVYTPTTVRIQCLVDATVKLTGTVSGIQYTFHGAGSIQKVDIRDKDEILDKKRGRACCGGNSGKALFQLVLE